MKKIFLSGVWLLLLLITGSCKKQEIKTTQLASIQITNAVIGGSALQFGTQVNTVANNFSSAYGVLTGTQSLKLYSKDNPGMVYYNQSHELVNGGVYSLFLTGVPGTVESVFLKEENIPTHTADVFGIRVINLSNSTAINVNISGSENGSLVNGLAYKAISVFKDVSSKAEEGDKTFEFRNADSGELITSFVVPGYDVPRFRNITLAFTGSVANEVVLRCNNY